MSDKERKMLDELSEDDLHALIDMARMYQLGRRAAVKAIVTAIVGALITVIGYGCVHWIKTIAASMVLAVLINVLEVL